MSVFNVNGPASPTITRIRWASSASPADDSYDLIRDASGTGVTIDREGLEEMVAGDCSLCCPKEEAESLIKALQKAIDLGWVK